jgi:dihydroneopterin aldolase
MFIRLHGIKIFAYHGVYDEEIRSGNHFEIDLEIETLDSVGAKTDVLTDTLDYSELYKEVITVSQKKRYNLLEALSFDICTKILASFPIAECVGVKVRKLNPPIGGEVQKKRTDA